MTEILIPRFYTSRDSGAPVLNSNNRMSLLNVLVACLADGYGSGADEKESLGWEKAWNSAGTRVVLSPQYGNGFPLLVYGDEGGTNNSHNTVRGLITFDGWDGDTLVGNPDLFGDGWVRKAHVTSVGDLDWMLIGTSRCFYFYSSYTGAGGDFLDSVFSAPVTHQTYLWRAAPWFYGDLSGFPNAQWNTLLAISTATATTNPGERHAGQTSYLGSGTSIIGKRLAASSSGLTLSFEADNRALFASPSSSLQAYSGVGLPSYPPQIGEIMLSPIGISDRASPANYGIVGFLPGIFEASHDLTDHQITGFNYMEEFEIGGNNFLLMPFGYPDNTNVGGGRCRGAVLMQTDAPWY